MKHIEDRGLKAKKCYLNMLELFGAIQKTTRGYNEGSSILLVLIEYVNYY